MSATGVHDAAPLGGGALLSRSRRRWLRRSACRWWPTRERRPKRAARGRTLSEPRGAVIVAGTALCAFVLCGHVCGFAGSCVVWGVVPWQRVSAARSPPMNIHVSGELLLWNHQPKQHSTSHGLLQVEDRDRGARRILVHRSRATTRSTLPWGAHAQAIARSSLSAAPASTTNLTDSLTQPR